MGLRQAKTSGASGANWIEEIAALVNEITGVKLGDRQSAMLEARLVKRIHQLGYQEPGPYLEYVRNNLENEVPKLVALLTTHHSFFFREFAHFQFLEEKGLRALVGQLRARGSKVLKVWSAACSQGQEVYSLAMFLSHHLKHLAPEIHPDILGTDVDPESIAKAINGVYRWQDLKQVPLTYLWNHWVRGTAEISDFAKAKPSIRGLCRFEVGNLAELGSKPATETFDIIFCRNVFIYFEADLIRQVSENLIKRLNPDGLFFIGLSESLMATGLPVLSLAPSVYAHRSSPYGGTTAPMVGKDPSPAAPSLSGQAGAARKYKVFCIDDSATILTLLKKILEPEFEVIGTASNGIDAAEKLKALRPDVVTLDIHMPEQGGIEYLEKHFNAAHAPVVILSSVPREDSVQAMRCLELGARDYIEKPELSDLETRADEIRTKVRCVVQTTELDYKGVSELDRSFHQAISVEAPERKLRLIFGGAAERGKMAFVLRECSGVQPPTVLLMEGSKGLLPSLAKSIEEPASRGCEVMDTFPAQLEVGRVYLGDFKKSIEELAQRASGKQVSILILGTPTEAMVKALAKFGPSEVILEDNGNEFSQATRGLKFRPGFFVPYTSMAYHSNKYLSQERGQVLHPVESHSAHPTKK